MKFLFVTFKYTVHDFFPPQNLKNLKSKKLNSREKFPATW